MLFSPPAVILGGKPTVSFLEARTATTSTPSFTGVSFGAAHSQREIFAVFYCQGTGANRTLDAMTIGGVSAVEHHQSGGFLEFVSQAGVFSAQVPTGTSGTVSITMSGSVTATNVAFYRVVRRKEFGGASLSDVVGPTPAEGTWATSSGTSISTTALAIPKNGLCFSAIRKGGTNAASISGASLAVNASETIGGLRSSYIASAPVAPAALASPTLQWSWSGSVAADAWAWAIL